LIDEQYDLQGLKVLQLSLQWTPYLYIDCQEEFSSNYENIGIANCSHDGALYELAQTVAKRWGEKLAQSTFDIN